MITFLRSWREIEIGSRWVVNLGSTLNNGQGLTCKHNISSSPIAATPLYSIFPYPDIASYVIFVYEQRKHPHNVYEMELFTEHEDGESGYSLRADPFLSDSLRIHLFFSPTVETFIQDENGENGKYCASYYLFTYLHFFPSFCCSFLSTWISIYLSSYLLVMIGGFEIALRLRLQCQKFHKLETTQRLLIFT